jgi:hypothetical protein
MQSLALLASREDMMSQMRTLMVEEKGGEF